MNKIFALFFLCFLGTSVVAMSNDQQIAPIDTSAISYKEAANAAFRGVICYGGKELVLYSLTLTGATTPIMVVVALGFGATYAAGYGYDRALAYASSASTIQTYSTESVEEIMDGFELMDPEKGSEDDILDDFCIVDLPGPTLIESASKTALNACAAACSGISNTVQSMPDTIANAISNAPYTICSGAVGAMCSAVILFSFCAVAGSAFAKNLSSQVLHIVFDEKDTADDAQKWLQEMQNAADPVATIYDGQKTINYSEDYNPLSM